MYQQAWRGRGSLPSSRSATEKQKCRDPILLSSAQQCHASVSKVAPQCPRAYLGLLNAIKLHVSKGGTVCFRQSLGVADEVFWTPPLLGTVQGRRVLGPKSLLRGCNFLRLPLQTPTSSPRRRTCSCSPRSATSWSPCRPAAPSAPGWPPSHAPASSTSERWPPATWRRRCSCRRCHPTGGTHALYP